MKMKEIKPYDSVIIGGGPAGLMAGISGTRMGKNMLILEKMHQPGLKLLISGNGRCNLTNIKGKTDFIDAFGRNGNFLYGVFSRFFSQDLIDFFESRGVELNVERGGRVFPKSGKSASVFKCLIDELKKLNVEIRINSKVEEILKNESNEITGVKLEGGDIIKTRSVILSSGGMSYPTTGSTGDGFRFAKRLGHTIVPPKPALVGLLVKEKEVLEWQGVDLKNIEISLYSDTSLIKKIFGDMSFTHFGISGPVILTISKTAVDLIAKGNHPVVSIDLKPALTREQLGARLVRDFKKMGSKAFKNFTKNLLPAKMVKLFVKITGIDPEKKVNQIDKAERLNLIQLLKAYRLNIIGSRPISEAIVTSGGVATDEINPKTMASKLVKGLFFAGEVIDIDAISGGYNLQAAFSTGFVAGESA